MSYHEVDRHLIVKQIINAYEKDTERQESGADDSTKPTEPKNK
ncbi:MAG: hypothetical protein ACK5DY_10650 [Bacteroidota bacterium]